MSRKISERAKMLKEIMSYEFTAIELNLYLDTHPGDMRALAEYNQAACQLRRLMHAYEQRFGPLLNFGMSPSQYPWKWIEEPWPWEVEF